MSTIRETLGELSHAADAFAQELDEAGYADYTFLPDNSPFDLSFLTSKGLEARGTLIAAAEKILRLARGPQGCLASFADTGIEMGTIQALTQLKVPDKVPLQGSITYEELAGAIQVAPELLQRLVRLAALAGFLVEDESGAVRHTAMSAVFLRDTAAGDTARFLFDVDMRAYSFFADSLRLDPSGRNIRDGPTSLAFQHDSNNQGNRPTIWDILERSPIQRARFHSTMQALGTFPSHLLKHILVAHDWHSIGSLVDVGGSLGHASLIIAENFPEIRITVQDLPEVIERGRSSLPTVPHAERLSFQAHDFFQEQATIADAYFLRQVLHDWPDADAERIVRCLIPAMRPGAKLLIMDIVVPEPGATSPYMEKYLRTYDVSMFSMFSGKERTVQQLRDLVERCSERLQFQGISCPPGSATSLLSWVYSAE
ncbi:6-hydroxytryprostatin B O-methyltransferase [Cladobotryum mycophilum]|uniref:6-hydroxytryprostatin B O-methyltransferase n=1 Tax=Cladobotryum mycophilum TaxID=491253 RepID=A0ABR0SEM7_9HYPO